MILYTLTLLGGFVFVQLVKSRSETEEIFRKASEWIRIQECLSDSKGYFAPAPAGAALKMFDAWVKLYSPQKNGTDGRTKINPAAKVRDACISTLLWTYAEEERLDLSGELPLDRIPRAVLPPAGYSAAGKVSYIATNVGYYATFLKELTPRLRDAADSYSSSLVPCMAVVTYVLPAHWWNWPTETAVSDAIYDPVVRYWESQRLFAKANGHIFRRVLVKPEKDTEGLSQLFWKNDRLMQGLIEKKLHFLVSPHVKGLKRIGTSREMRGREDDIPGSHFARLHPDQEKLVEERLKHALKSSNRIPPLSVYWLLDFNGERAECKCTPRHQDNKCISNLEDIYREVFHPNGGQTEFFTVNDKTFLTNPMKDPLMPENSAFKPGLNDCADIMFLGLSDPAKVWERDGSQEWGCALKATMGRNTETMFLTIFHDSEAVQNLWYSIYDAFKAHEKSVESIYKIKSERTTS